ncbi:GNAT family N-acetyltransferase [Saccharospirillum salsuginis]|nr:GNAT family N-acetyltransferase [Saccharospirillum salsuginis]
MDELENDWRDLERRSMPAVFLSWQWIGVWLHVYKPAGRLVRIYESSRLIGACIIVDASERRHGLLTSKCIRLHQTGRSYEDQIWIEYNGVLSEHGRERDVIEACLAHLCLKDDRWEEFVIGAIDERDADCYARSTGLAKHVRWEAPCYGVDLHGLAQNQQSYLDSLNRNTRHQIRRSMRLYNDRGGLHLSRAESLDSALASFESIGPRHLARWGNGVDQSGFANPDFIRFHRRMIEQHWPNASIDLLNIWSGDELVGTFYNLLYQGVVYFYLSGLKVEEDNRLKPGLVGHAMSIEHYRSRGFGFYDFMGGSERYKTQMGRKHRNLVQISLQRNRFKFRLEQAARLVKHQLLRTRRNTVGQSNE